MKYINLTVIIAIIINLYGCDIPNKDLRLVNNTSNRMNYSIFFDTINLEPHDWYIGDYVSSLDTVYPHTVFGGKGALEYSMISRTPDSCLYLLYSIRRIANDSDLVRMVREKDYIGLKYKVSDLKLTDWTITINE
jgi:hypothetical protein